MNELLRIIWGYVHKGFSRYGDILYVNSDEYNEWNVDDIGNQLLKRLQIDNRDF